MFISDNKIKFLIPSIFFVTIVLLLFIPDNAYSEPKKIQSWINTASNKTLYNNESHKNYLDNSYGLQISKNYQNLFANMALNIDNNENLTFDQSYINYNHSYGNLGIGKINRNWSFSPITSLILSTNSRPPDSIYYTFLNDKPPQNVLMSWIKPTSFEIFNALLSDKNNPRNSKLLGLRAIISPSPDLKFEIIQTAQWGGKGNNNDFSALRAAFLGSTNEKNHSNINKLAGIGVSYSTSLKDIPLRFYGQIIGEDEAGGLPSCTIYLFGNELSFPKYRFISKFGFEYIDTRIDTTENGYCGPNTAYNNKVYKYTNYGVNMGAPIDSEGRSINIWGSAKLSNTTNINYSIKNILINDTAIPTHRLSNTKQHGWFATVGAGWTNGLLKIQGNIRYHGFNLNKENIYKGLSYGLFTTYNF